jgi:hypothetical protein
MDSEDAFKVAWTIAATAGALVNGVNALLNSFRGLVDRVQVEETRALVSQFGRHTQGRPAELLADRGRLLAELELKLEELSEVVRDSATRAPEGALLRFVDRGARDRKPRESPVVNEA